LTSFDFDAWRELAARDPAGYFRERERVIADFIAERPESEHSLREFQSHIDQVRALAGAPAAAARQLAAMLGDRLEALAGHLKLLDDQTTLLQRLAQRGH
jgi:hypothetical protein